MAKATSTVVRNAGSIVVDVTTAQLRAQTDAAIDKAITSISTRGLSLTADVQKAAVAGLAYYALCDASDANHLTKLLNAVVATKGLNAKKLQGYIVAAAPSLEYATDKVGNKIFKKRRDVEKDSFNDVMTFCGASMWGDWKPAQKEMELDLDKLCASFVKKALKAEIEDGVAVSDSAIVEAVKRALEAAHKATK
jgi:hypothetical protein